MMKKVSVIIPVLRESGLLESTIRKLLNDTYQNKEIIVAIDEPTKIYLKTMKRFKNRVRFLVSERRRGKSHALNEAAKKATGDVLFFFDSDNIIRSKKDNTISELVEEMSDKDVAEFRTNLIKDSYISKIASFDYINSNFVSLLYSKFVKMKPAIGGMAFAIKRSVFDELGGFRNYIAEDVDIGWRAFERKKSYVLIKSIPISTKSPSNMKEWLSQRKRWAIGTAEWFFRNPKSILVGNAKKAPYLTVPSLFLVLPTLLLGLISFFLSESLLEQIIIFSLAIIPLKFAELSGFTFLIISSMTVFKSVVIYALGFTISITSTYAASRLLKYEFSFIDFVVFYFLYSPMVLATYLYGLFVVGVFKNTRLADWKV